MSQHNSLFMRRGDNLKDKESNRNFGSQFHHQRQNSYQNEFQDRPSSDAGRNSDRTYTSEDRGYKNSLKMNDNHFNNNRGGPYRQSPDRSYQVPYHRKYPPSRNQINPEYQPENKQYSSRNQFRSDSHQETAPRFSRNQFCSENPPYLQRNQFSSDNPPSSSSNQFHPDFTAYSTSNPSKNQSRPEFPTECQPYSSSNQYREQFPTEISSNHSSNRYPEQFPTESSSNPPSNRYREQFPTESSSNPSSNRYREQFPTESSSNPPSNRYREQFPTESSSNPSSNRYREQFPTESSSNPSSNRYREQFPTESSSNPSSNRYREQFPTESSSNPSSNRYREQFPTESSSNPSSNRYHEQFPTESSSNPSSNRYREQFPTESSSNPSSNRYREQFPTESSSNPSSNRYHEQFPTESSSNPSSNRYREQFPTESSSNPSSNRYREQFPTETSSNPSSNRYREQFPTESSSNPSSNRYCEQFPTESSSNPSSNQYSQQFRTESSSNSSCNRYREQFPTESSSNPSSNQYREQFPTESSSNLPKNQYRPQFPKESSLDSPKNQCDSNSLAKNPSYPPRNQFRSEFPTESSPNPTRNKFYTQDQHQSYSNEKFEPQEPNWHHPNVGEFERMASFNCSQKNQQQSPLDRIPALSSQNPLNSKNNESINAASSKNDSNVGNKFQSLIEFQNHSNVTKQTYKEQLGSKTQQFSRPEQSFKNTRNSKKIRQCGPINKRNKKDFIKESDSDVYSGFKQVISPEDSKHAYEFRLIEHILPVEKEYSEITIDDFKNREGPVGDIVIMHNKHKDKTYFKILNKTADTWNMNFELKSEQSVSAEGKESWIATALFNDVELAKAQGENKAEVRTAASARALWKLYQWYFTVERDEGKKAQTHELMKGDLRYNDVHIVPNRASQIGVQSIKATFQTIKNKNLNDLKKQIASYANNQNCLGYLILSENFNAITRKSLLEYAKTFKCLITPKFKWNLKSQVAITKLEDEPGGWALIEHILEKRVLYKSSGEYQLYFPGKFPFPIPYDFPGIEFLI